MNYPLTLEQYIAQMPMQEAELARMVRRLRKRFP